MVTYFKEVIKRGILGADVFSKTSEQSTAVTRKCVENMWLLKDGSSHMVQINGNDCKRQSAAAGESGLSRAAAVQQVLSPPFTLQ